MIVLFPHVGNVTLIFGLCATFLQSGPTLRPVPNQIGPPLPENRVRTLNSRLTGIPIDRMLTRGRRGSERKSQIHADSRKLKPVTPVKEIDKAALVVANIV
ncbi:hypothetical protein A2U01_0041914, partial [Trifolium medium]|nr:hypothetical protein [Trifolium medium]